MTDDFINQLRSNDKRAQKQLYEHFSERMFKLCFRYISNEQDAASVVNIGFYKIFKNILHFRFISDAAFIAWMKRIVTNEALKFLKSNFNFYNLSKPIEEHFISEMITDANLSQEDYYKLICELDVGYRTVFNLFVIDGYSHQEIAQMLNIQEGTSRSQLSRARNILKQKIQQL